MRIVNISHFDLDGVTCSMFLRKAFGDIETYMIGYEDIEKTMEKITDKANVHLIVTDINLAGRNTGGLKDFGAVTIIDHHQNTVDYSATKYDVLIDTSRCATWLTYQWLYSNGYALQSKWMDEWSFAVDVYDRWQVKHPKWQLAKELNAYLYISKDKTAFTKEAMLKSPSEIVQDNLSTIAPYLDNQEKYVYETPYYDVSEGKEKIAVAFAEKHASIIGDFLLMEKGFDLVYIINPRKGNVSLRSGTDGIVDCAKLGAKFGGGGHQPAGGFILDEKTIRLMIDSIGLKTKELPRRKGA